MRLEDEIKQKIFASEHIKAHVNILFTASWLSLGTTKALKELGISPHQFNILRILKGMHPHPGSIKELTERMIDKSSNASRLVDKLISKELVNKTKCDLDNRRAEVVISAEGIELLKDANSRIDGLVEEMAQHITKSEAHQLNSLLDKLRG